MVKIRKIRGKVAQFVLLVSCCSPVSTCYYFLLLSFDPTATSSLEMDRFRPDANRSKLFLSELPKEMVFFKIKGHTEMIKIQTSVLVENSTVFRDMEQLAGKEPMEPIEINDSTEFHLFDGFMAFVEALHGFDLIKVTDPSDFKNYYKDSLRMQAVYYFADKYHIQWLMDKCVKVCKKTFFKERLASSPRRLGRNLRLARALGLAKEFKDVQKQELRFHIKDVLPFFNLAKEFVSEDIMASLVRNCCEMEPDVCWPPELFVKVLKKVQHRLEEAVKSSSESDSVDN